MQELDETVLLSYNSAIVHMLIEGVKILVRIKENGSIFGRLSVVNQGISIKYYQGQRKND